MLLILKVKVKSLWQRIEVKAPENRRIKKERHKEFKQKRFIDKIVKQRLKPNLF